MAYKYQVKNGSCIEVVNMMAGSKDLSKPMVDELDEVYRKARLLDDVVATTERRLSVQERKAKAWDSLKELLMKDYPTVEHLADVSNGDGERGELSKHEEVLEHMDFLDGTNEFSNLLSDLEDE